MTEELIERVKLPEKTKENKPTASNKSSREFNEHCDKCEAKFRTREALKEHIAQKHLKAKANVVVEKEFICDDCDEKFTTLRALEEHEENHDGII